MLVGRNISTPFEQEISTPPPPARMDLNYQTFVANKLQHYYLLRTAHSVTMNCSFRHIGGYQFPSHEASCSLHRSNAREGSDSDSD